MRRGPWRLGILFALLLGVGLGLGYTWVLFPHRATDAQPGALRADFKDQYRSVVAASRGDRQPRAGHVSLLGDANPSLNAQVQRMLAAHRTGRRSGAKLASALKGHMVTTRVARRPDSHPEVISRSSFTPTFPPPTDIAVLLPNAAVNRTQRRY
jgi:hypothetical protein